MHASDWQPRPLTRPDDEKKLWAGLFALREQVLPELEKARQAKTIGKALEAKLILHRNDLPGDGDAAATEILRELLNVSQLAFGPGENLATVERAEGQKCERCWHWELDIGKDPAHATICGRCATAIKSLQG